MDKRRWTTALLIAHLCGSAYAGEAGFGRIDDDPSPPSPSAKPATPDTRKGASPSIEETIDFLHRILPSAASFQEVLQTYETTGWKKSSLNVSMTIERKTNDFLFAIDALWSDRERPDKFRFKLSQVKVSGDFKSNDLFKDDWHHPLVGLLFRCEIGACIEHTRVRFDYENVDKKRPLLHIPIGRGDVEKRLLSALRHLQSFIKPNKEPF